MKGFCVALGLFDCVHKGHRKVLEEAVSIAEGNDLTAAAVTFDECVEYRRELCFDFR